MPDNFPPISSGASTTTMMRYFTRLRDAILDLMSSFMESGAFENMDFIDRSALATPPSDPVWTVSGRKAFRQQARWRAGETA